MFKTALNPALRSSLYASKCNVNCLQSKIISNKLHRRNYGWFSDLLSSNKVVYPDRQVGVYNSTRIFDPIRYGDNELNNYLISVKDVPLILNFTIRGDRESSLLSERLYKVLNYETKKRVYCVEVEADLPENVDLILTYSVKKIPSLVAIHRREIVERFVPQNGIVTGREIEEWIDKFAVE